MFNRKRSCKNCSKKIEKDFDFCPYCGKSTIKEDYGFLGREDNNFEGLSEISNNKNITGSILDKLLANAMRMLQKEMNQLNDQKKDFRSIDKNIPTGIKTGFQLYINGKKVPLNGETNNIQKTNKNNYGVLKNPPLVSEEVIKNSLKLPRKEIKTKLTRLKDKVIYQLKIPGLVSLEEVLINRLEESLEIRVYTKKAVYQKNIQIKLPLVKYYIREEKLFLEFKVN